jgi:hypothetical protein
MLFCLVDKQDLDYYNKEVIPNTAKTNFDYSRIDYFDFSGVGLFTWYKRATKFKYTVPDVNLKFQQQMMIHATFGTQWEDRVVLKKMFGVDFDNRKTMGSYFQKYGGIEKTVEMDFITPIWGSKLASAKLRPTQISNKMQTLPCPTFAGRRTHPVTKIAVQSLTTDQGQNVAGSKEPIEIAKSLEIIREKANHQYMSLKTHPYGSVGWIKVQDLSFNIKKEDVQRHEETWEGGNLYYDELDDDDAQMADLDLAQERKDHVERMAKISKINS